jgi:AAA15 family ATPase/GTPase
MNNNQVQLIELRIKNFRSFYSEQRLLFSNDETNARQVTAIFGANASGKSNTARALLILQKMIRESANANSRPYYDPFAFQLSTTDEPSELSVKFNHNGKIFVYTFSCNRKQIISEELREKSASSNKYKTIFSRDKDKNLNSAAGNYGFSKNLANKTRLETLLITKAKEDNNKYANIVFDLVDSLYLILDNGQNIEGFAVNLLNKHPELQDDVIKALNQADFAIRDIRIDNAPIPEEIINRLPIPDEEKITLRSAGALNMFLGHYLRDGEQALRKNNKTSYIGLDIANESMGTRKFFAVIVPIIDAIKKGKTLYIDEFGAYLHPNLADTIVNMYKSDSSKRAKLILNTHMTSLMNSLERDDIVIVEKRRITEESVITSLKNKSASNTDLFEKRYRQGLYGGIPKRQDLEITHAH